MTPEIVKYLCDLDISNHIQLGESIEDWFKRLTKVAIEIASNPNTPQEILVILAQDFDYNMRWHITRNPNIPLESLNMLALNSDFRIQYHIANNHNISQETFANLAKDSVMGVRWYVA